MARFETSGLDDIIEQMKDLGELTGQVADDMLLAGAEQVKIAWKESAEKHKHRDTGRMIKSIKPDKKPKTVDEVRTIEVYPRGTDPTRKYKNGDKVRNAEKAFVLNYGTSGKNGDGWVDEANEAAGPMAEQAMIDIWNDYLKERGF